MPTIQNQINLPIKVALGVVMQGIRIRFGRSVVTILGVMFGIAFLMSILTGQVIKTGVKEEDEIRKEVRRMFNFLTAEMGPPKGRTLGVIQIGSLNEAERRLLRELEKKGLQQFNVVQNNVSSLLKEDIIDTIIGSKAELKTCPIDAVGDNANALMVIGEGSVSQLEWDRIFEKARQKVVAVSRNSIELTVDESVTVVSLERQLRPEELEKIKIEYKKTQFRNTWIIIISLLVTVMGISNAMLMSVTERFREIGTMKCLGALSSFIRTVFLIEACFMGLVGGIFGAFTGAFFSLLVYGLTYGIGVTFSSLSFSIIGIYLLLSITGGIVLSAMAAIYPASVASAMIPANALRANI